MRHEDACDGAACGSKTANSPTVLRSAESSADHQTQIVTPFSFLNDRKASGVRRNRVTAPRESTNVPPANACFLTGTEVPPRCSLLAPQFRSQQPQC